MTVYVVAVVGVVVVVAWRCGGLLFVLLVRVVPSSPLGTPLKGLGDGPFR